MPLMPSHTAPRPEWPLWIAGVALGELAIWIFLRPRADREGVPFGVSQALSTTPARLAAARARPVPDLAAITERLRAHAGTEQLVVRSLGGGILELVGSATDQLDLPAVLDELATEPGVSVVVNRVWPSRSGAP